MIFSMKPCIESKQISPGNQPVERATSLRLRDLRNALFLFRPAVAGSGDAVPVLRIWPRMDKLLATKNKAKKTSGSPVRETLADRTNANAREIVAAEAKKRHDLTVLLRAARLAKEAEPTSEPIAKSRKNGTD